MAQAKTRACAEADGMGNGTALHMISEPEAAALYTLNTMDPHLRCRWWNCDANDRFIEVSKILRQDAANANG